MTATKSPQWVDGFKADYDKLFVKKWSSYLGAVLLMVVIFALMINGMVWGVFGGVKFWGNWLNTAIGLGPWLGLPAESGPIWMHSMSLMNIMLVMGAFCAALLSRQFAPLRPPKIEYLWAALGGTLMGIGASLAGGCTTGGFFNPVLHASPAGWAMWVGLLAGAAVGFKMLLWTLEHVEWGTQAPAVWQLPKGVTMALPWWGGMVALGTLVLATLWFYSGNAPLVYRAPIVLAGFAIGFIMHRSRLCFARAFREPFVTGEGEMSKAVILALAIGLPVAALLFQKKVIDPYAAIPATFWIGSLVGGLIFGMGMVFAGGCASGSLWRMGEGHIKLWVAMFFFAWSGSTASALFKKYGLTAIVEDGTDTFDRTALGFQAFMPELLSSWGWTLWVSGGLLLLWYALVRYNESTEKFTLM
ncbi:hypothetical protein MIZ03_2985 [Rhodoferax lithotrophicus]|uniref:Inner membrane protein n=1 Tax=Rhodoferax lithotrophicus TaxID=2798804 RepID=A0ABM7MP36_9BURK|nr:YeeE/YedE thiosulfate transporter family protein [Rhodoferax sp. MIZ03]BCO28089.1 hypothetical protein MIZ03_2985 [Rhodoferax sp. MIZ03]